MHCIGRLTGLVQSATIDPTSKEGKLKAKLVDLRVKSAVALIMTKSDEEFEALWQKTVNNTMR